MPIVFAAVADPVGAGYVESLPRPGGNATGFAAIEYSMAGKWLELLKEIAPRVTRVAVLRDSAIAAGPGFLGALQAPAVIARCGATPRRSTRFRRDRTFRGSVRKVPKWWPHRVGKSGGDGPSRAHRHSRDTAPAAGSLCHSHFCRGRRPDLIRGRFSRSIPTRSRLRRSHPQREKPADLPVQAPTKYELVVNLKTAKALGLDMPATLLARADEVIE